MFNQPTPVNDRATDVENIALLNQIIQDQDFVTMRFGLSECRYHLRNNFDGSLIPDDEAERRFEIHPISEETPRAPHYWTNDAKNSLMRPLNPNSYYMNTYLSFRSECLALIQIFQTHRIQAHLISGPGIVVERDESLNACLRNNVNHMKNEFNEACKRIELEMDSDESNSMSVRVGG